MKANLIRTFPTKTIGITKAGRAETSPRNRYSHSVKFWQKNYKFKIVLAKQHNKDYTVYTASRLQFIYKHNEDKG